MDPTSNDIDLGDDIDSYEDPEGMSSEFGEEERETY